MVQDFENNDTGVKVTLSDGSVDSYDLLVVADGQSSSLRQKIMASEPEGSDQSRNLGVYSAYYTISRTPDDPDLATVYVGPDKRIMCTRWHSQERGQGYLATMAHQQEIEMALKQDVDTQKKLFEDIFTDAGWEANRLVENLKQADDFYAHSSVQIKVSRWSRGRVALLGDAAYAPTPLTGMGTSLALIGAYVLAGEIHKAGNICNGIKTYEKVLRPLVEESQQLPIRLPSLAYPSSHLGVKAFYWFAGLASTLKLDKLGDIPFFKKSDPWNLPQYDELCSIDRTQANQAL
jgi:2-polyprenyl-6-methoxyphenol hydroxylase-like FAD-dependent oxidoreductase